MNSKGEKERRWGSGEGIDLKRYSARKPYHLWARTPSFMFSVMHYSVRFESATQADCVLFLIGRVRGELPPFSCCHFLKVVNRVEKLM